jgi:hypothetical protein
MWIVFFRTSYEISGAIGGVAEPIHDHVDGLGVGFVGYNFGVFAEEFEDSVSGRVPRDLYCQMLHPIKDGGKDGGKEFG